MPSRHQLVEINLNKAITKKLASAVHYQRVGFPVTVDQQESLGREVGGWGFRWFF
jgi:hypothetical protein